MNSTFENTNIQAPPDLNNLRKRLKRKKYRIKKQKQKQKQELFPQQNDTPLKPSIIDLRNRLRERMINYQQQRIKGSQDHKHEQKNGSINPQAMFEKCGITDKEAQHHIIQAIQSGEVKSVKDLSNIMQIYQE